MGLGRGWAPVGERALRAAATGIFLVGAGMKLATLPFEVSSFERFGYAPWFMYLIGVAQLLGAALLWVPGWIGLAALGLGAMMVGAAASHLLAGDPTVMALPATALTVVLLTMAYARRREFATRLERRTLPGRARL